MVSLHRFGTAEVRPVERRLLVDGRVVPIGARAFDLLLLLIENRARVVTKEEILDSVWQGRVVEEANVQMQVSALRKALGPACIATIPGRGYRFAAVMADDDAAGHVVLPVAALAATGAELIGRESDQAALECLLDSHRLVTLVGPGGVGKTRLSQSVVATLSRRRGDSARWVDVAALSAAHQVVPALARAAGIGLPDGCDSRRLAAGLADCRMLLVLDNCEHLANEVASVVATVLEQCPDLTVLVTSQEPLHVTDEQVYRLAGLEMPSAEMPLERARTVGAMRLFEVRLQATDRRRNLDDAELRSAMALCRHLDGNALAIEMAAARVPVLGIDRVLELLDERLRLLTTVRRDLPPRQQSLRAMLEWSHRLLSEDERKVLRRTAVFAGTFSLEAAQDVVADEQIDRWAVVESIAALVDRSMVHVESCEPPRYRLLESIRAYAKERLEAAGETGVTEWRHGMTLASLADRAVESLWVMNEDDWLARFEPERADLEAAFDRACARSDATVVASTGKLLCTLDDVRSQSVAVRERKEAALALLPHADLLAKARLWSCLTWHGAIAIAAVPRLSAATSAVAAWRAVGDRRELYLALCQLAGDCVSAGDASTARSCVAEAKALEERTWSTRLRWMGATAADHVATAFGDSEKYLERFKEALALAQQAGSLRCVARTRLNVSDHALMAGDVDNAIVFGLEAAADMRRLRQPAALGWALSNLCAAYLVAGELDRACQAAAEALPLMWAHGWGVDLLNHIALIAALQGRHSSAAQLLGYAESAYTAAQDKPLRNEAALADRASSLAAAAIGRTDMDRSLAQGAALSASEAERLARSLVAFDPVESNSPVGNVQWHART